MRTRTPRPDSKKGQQPGPNDQAYLDYGSLSESATGGSQREVSGGGGQESQAPPWRQVLLVLLLMSVPFAILLLVWAL